MTDREILGVGPDADLAEVKERWQKLALELHPDHGGDAASFARALKAYRRLLESLSQPKECARCAGTGRIGMTSGFYVTNVTCPRCRGTGKGST